MPNTMSLSTTERAILFFVDRLSGHLGKTQMVKLLFLADLEHYRQTGRQLTDLEYHFLTYGPFDSSIERRIVRLKRNKLISEKRQPRLDSGYYFRYSPATQVTEYFSALPPTQILILDEIAENYGKMTLRSLLEFVYRTPQMLNARRGGRINFDRIQALQEIRRESEAAS